MQERDGSHPQKRNNIHGRPRSEFCTKDCARRCVSDVTVVGKLAVSIMMMVVMVMTVTNHRRHRPLDQGTRQGSRHMVDTQSMFDFINRDYNELSAQHQNQHDA